VMVVVSFCCDWRKCYNVPEWSFTCHQRWALRTTPLCINPTRKQDCLFIWLKLFYIIGGHLPGFQKMLFSYSGASKFCILIILIANIFKHIVGKL
ncbi:hypothetical protein AVEN_23357-1, partial [Araneus ventricosus]